MITLKVVAARERCIDIRRPRPRSRPQGRLRHHRQPQEAQEGYRRRRQGAAIAAARREAAEAKARAEVLFEKMKTMEATLSRVAAMLPSWERLRRREDAAAAKIQAAVKCYAERRKVEDMMRLQNFFRTVTGTAVRGWSRQAKAAARLRLQRCGGAAATKIQAALRGFRERKAVRIGLRKLHDIASHIYQRKKPLRCSCANQCATCLHSEAVLNWCDWVFDTGYMGLRFDRRLFKRGKFNFRKTVTGGGVLTVLKDRYSVLDLLNH